MRSGLCLWTLMYNFLSQALRAEFNGVEATPSDMIGAESIRNVFIGSWYVNLWAPASSIKAMHLILRPRPRRCWNLELDWVTITYYSIS